MSNLKVKNPIIIKNLLSEKDFLHLKNFMINQNKKEECWDNYYGRYLYSNKLIKSLHQEILPLARNVFQNNNILPSYSLFSEYQGKNAKLPKHKDDNACTYTIDLCVYYNKLWSLFIEEEEFFILENEAIAFYGEDQVHWRESFPDPETNKVGVIFFHFVEPEHWFFEKGPRYIEVIRGIATEEEYNARNQ